jgi:hypothetical protein
MERLPPDAPSARSIADRPTVNRTIVGRVEAQPKPDDRVSRGQSSRFSSLNPTHEVSTATVSRHVGSLATVFCTALACAPVAAGYSVQLGTFADPTNAARLVERVEAAGLPVATRDTTTARGERLTRVLAGPFPDRETGDAALAAARITAPADPATPTAASPRPAAPAAVSHSRGPRNGANGRLMLAGVDGQPDAPGTRAQEPRVSGFLQTEAGYAYSGEAHWQKLRGVAEIALDGRWNEWLKWKVSGRGYYDFVFDATNYYPEDVRDDRQKELMFRETYLDIAGENWDFRVGRQHIVWGEMVGVFVADVVSAQDQREFILRDFDWIRTPQWAARAEYFSGNFHAEGIWIPYMTYDEIGKPGDDYYPYPLPAPPGFRTIIRGDDRPADSLDHSAGGVRLSWLDEGWDTSLFYYTSMNAAPAFARQTVQGPDPAFVYTPTHDRIHQGGLTVSKDFGLGVFKAEAVYTHDGLLETSSLSDADGLVKLDYLDYILGVEFVTENETRLNFQFYQRWFSDYDPNIVPDEVESGVTAFVSTKALHPDVEPELLVIRSLNRDDWLVRAKVSWRFLPNWRAVGGVDILQGPVDGLIGRYADSDRVYAEVRYSF